MKKVLFFLFCILVSLGAFAALPQAIVDSLGDMRSAALVIAFGFVAAFFWVAAIKLLRRSISLPPASYLEDFMDRSPFDEFGRFKK